MKKRTTVLVAFLGIVFFMSLSAFTPQTEGQKKGAPWDIPESYKTKVNPNAGDESLVSVGKMIYMKHCRSCHGNTGMGDGPKARNLETFPGKFNDPKFQEEADGVIYYQSIIGRGDMPNYESKIPDDEDRWAIVMYLRTLK